MNLQYNNMITFVLVFSIFLGLVTALFIVRKKNEIIQWQWKKLAKSKWKVGVFVGFTVITVGLSFAPILRVKRFAESFFWMLSNILD